MKRKELTKTCTVYDDFKLTENVWSPWFIQKYLRVVGVDLYNADVFLYKPRRQKVFFNLKSS